MKSKIKILARVIAVFCLIFLIASCDKSLKKVKDIERNEYDVVKIGDQYWLKQNLRTTKYNDGTPINEFIENQTDGFSNNIGCYANIGDPAHIKDSTLYGKFYNWHAVNSGKLAPKGWHVPTKYDWEKLDKFLSKDGKKLSANKLRTTTQWLFRPDIGKGLDTYGFSAYPAGNITYGCAYWKDSDAYSTRYQYAIFWTSTLDYIHKDTLGRLYPYSIIVGTGNPMLVKDELGGYPNNGFSVRCVKD